MAWPVAARAQPTERMRRIGVLVGLAENDPEMKQRLAGFREGLEKLAWSATRQCKEPHCLKPWVAGASWHEPPHSIGCSMQDSPTRGQVILALLLGILWGLNWPTVKIALAEIGPWPCEQARCHSRV